MNAFAGAIGALAGAVCGVAVLAAPAEAAPVNSPQGEEPVTVTCTGGDLVVLAAPGSGNFTPSFIVGTHQVLVPYKFIFEVTGGEEPQTMTISKAASVPDGAIECSYTEIFTDEAGDTFVFTLTAIGVIRGKP